MQIYILQGNAIFFYRCLPWGWTHPRLESPHNGSFEGIFIKQWICSVSIEFHQDMQNKWKPLSYDYEAL